MEPLKLIGMKKQPSQARGMERVLAILDACETMLGRKRYDEISIDEILATANVAKGTLYHFFTNRRAVFLAAMHRALLDIDNQADPRAGEEQLGFAEYLSKVERRLQAVWRKHSHLVEFYESNKYSPDYQIPELAEQLRAVDVVAEQLLARHPEIGKVRAQQASSTLLHAISTGLDAVALQPIGLRAGFQREWKKMIACYVDELVPLEGGRTQSAKLSGVK